MRHTLLLFGSLLFATGCSKSAEEMQAAQAKTTQLLAAMRSDLEAGKLDSAIAKVDVAQSLFEDGDVTMASLNGLKHQLTEAGTPATVEEKVARLSPQGLKALQKGDNIKYFDDPDVNKFFLARMQAKAPEWANLHKAQVQEAAKEKQRQAELTRTAANMVINERRSYATTLRNNFLDSNLDIDVAVTGKNATHLTLKFALFSAVWTRKFQTEGLISKWQDMGFTRIDITDGYDYSVYFASK